MFKLQQRALRQFLGYHRSAFAKLPQRLRPPLQFVAGAQDTCIRAAGGTVALELRLEAPATSREPFAFQVAASDLARIKGDPEDWVEFRQQDEEIQICWMHHELPCQQLVAYEVPPPVAEGKSAPFWEAANQLHDTTADLFWALAHAVNTAADTSSRYALDCLRLRGLTGDLIATDGRHALIQSGFEFPWQDELTIPACDLLATAAWLKQVQQSGQSLQLGLIQNWIVLGQGDWRVYLQHLPDLRFPDVDGVFRFDRSTYSRLHVGQRDAQVLKNILPHLPSGAEQNRSVTLQLNGQIVLLARESDRYPVTVVDLEESEYFGDPVAVAFDRNFLQQALAMGFIEILVRDASSLIVCEDQHRQYGWMPLHESALIHRPEPVVEVQAPALVGAGAA
jgi:hypothetical protein